MDEWDWADQVTEDHKMCPGQNLLYGLAVYG